MTTPSAPTARPPVAITGLGCLGAAGVGLAAQTTALRSGACGLHRRDDPRLPLAATLPIGRVDADLPRLPGRTAALAVVAGAEALAGAGLHAGNRADIAVVIGSCTAGMPESERDFLDGGDADAVWPSYRRQQTHCLTAMVARHLGCGGLRSAHSVACASAAAALIEATELVRSGRAERVLAIGADALCRLTMAGFHSLHLVDPAGCRPFAGNRAGMSLGEGAAALVVESAASVGRRGARPLAWLAGWGLRADAYHITSPDPAGTQLDRAIADALSDAGVAASSIGYVSAHGTGTVDNDACEAVVIARRFGAVPMASCKRTYGHTLGAAAAIEAVACCLALAGQEIWPSAGAADAVDAGNGHVLAGPEIVRRARPARLDAVLSTTLAFGGVNAALVFTPGDGPSPGEAP